MEKIQIVTPQFERTDGRTIRDPGFTPEEWDALPSRSHDQLKLLGLGVFSKTEKGTHYLYPVEWYDFIPEGHRMKCINGNTEIFRRGVTDNDTRFGCIAYGFVKPAEVS